MPLSLLESTYNFFWLYTNGLSVILANLYGPLLIQIVPSLIQLLAPKGWLVLGGMAVPHDEVVISTFTQHGLKVHTRYYDEEWSAAVLQRI